MNPRIASLLRELYGPRDGDCAAQNVENCLRQHAAQNQTRPPNHAALTQRDALLITYADQVRQPGEFPLQTLTAFCARHLEGVVSGIHLLPFYPWSSDDGFSVKDFFAVDPAFGTWADISRLGERFDLMFDAVFNHVSAQGEWFKAFLAGDERYRDFFVVVEGNPDLSQVVRPRALPLLTEFATADGPRRVWTTFSADQVDLNFKNPRVLLAALEALLFYTRQGARFIRLDAIAFLWKEIGTSCLHRPQTHQVIQLFRTVLDEAAPHVRLITETNVPHADNVSYFGDGTNEAQLVYNFALPPLVLHSFQTGQATELTAWAQTLAPPSANTAFFNFLASHDGIGLNPVRGILREEQVARLVSRAVECGGLVSYKHLPDGSRAPYELNLNYFDAMGEAAAETSIERQIARFLCAHAILLSLQGVPAIYFHSLFGSRGDRAGAEASGIPRRINREKLERTALERELAAPDSRRARVFGGLRRLLRTRRAHSAFDPAGEQRVLALDPRLFVVLRLAPDHSERVLCLHNVSGDTLTVPRAWLEAAGGGEWKNLLAEQEMPVVTTEVRLPGYGYLWLRSTTGQATVNEGMP